MSHPRRDLQVVPEAVRVQSEGNEVAGRRQRLSPARISLRRMRVHARARNSPRWTWRVMSAAPSVAFTVLKMSTSVCATTTSPGATTSISAMRSMRAPVMTCGRVVT